MVSHFQQKVATKKLSFHHFKNSITLDIYF